MRVSGSLFIGGAIAFTPVALIYAFWTGWAEWVGIVGLFLLGGMTGMVGFYLRATARRLDVDPADKPRAMIAESAGEYGFFSPHSWWPLVLGAAAATIALGLAVGWWIFVIGIVAGVLTLVGWAFEYFRGDVI